MCLENISLNLEEERNYGCNRDDENISRTNIWIDEELCVYFIDWQKAFDRVNWTKLMQILKKIGIDLRERKLISKF